MKRDYAFVVSTIFFYPEISIVRKNGHVVGCELCMMWEIHTLLVVFVVLTFLETGI